MKLAIVMPAYNEAQVLGGVLERIPRRLPQIDTVDIIVVDDGSRDDTGKIAKEHGAIVLTHLINRGYGGALGTGLSYAKEEGYGLAVTMDSDGQHDPAELPSLIELILADRADMVVGTRLVHAEGMPMVRRVGIWGFNVIALILFGVWTTDSHSGFRSFNRRALREMQFDFRGMEVSPGFFSEVARLGLRLKEVPIRAIYTDYSIAKGQRPFRNLFPILFRLIWHKLSQ